MPAAILALAQEPTQDLLPTPTASLPNDAESLESWEARRQRNLEKGYNGNGQGTPLAIAVQLLPTPTARDGDSSGSAAYSTSSGRHSGTTLTDAVVRQVNFAQFEKAIAHWQQIIGRPAPDPLLPNGRLSPLFVEWMMGLEAGHVTGTDLSRTRQLKVLGNGVCPPQAALALKLLGFLGVIFQ